MLNGKKQPKQPKLETRTSHQFNSRLRGTANRSGSSCGSAAPVLAGNPRKPQMTRERHRPDHSNMNCGYAVPWTNRNRFAHSTWITRQSYPHINSMMMTEYYRKEFYFLLTLKVAHISGAGHMNHLPTSAPWLCISGNCYNSPPTEPCKF
jgi:hypothetical protein